MATPDANLVGCCGLYCGDCGIGNGKVQNAAKAFEALLNELGYPQFVPTLAEQVPAARHYPEFAALLKWIGDEACPGCQAGGGDPNCPSRNCSREKGYTGCWQCERETCEKLAPYDTAHPEMVAERRKMALVGVESWLAERRTAERG